MSGTIEDYERSVAWLRQQQRAAEAGIEREKDGSKRQESARQQADGLALVLERLDTSLPTLHLTPVEPGVLAS